MIQSCCFSLWRGPWGMWGRSPCQEWHWALVSAHYSTPTRLWLRVLLRWRPASVGAKVSWAGVSRSWHRDPSPYLTQDVYATSASHLTDVKTFWKDNCHPYELGASYNVLNIDSPCSAVSVQLLWGSIQGCGKDEWEVTGPPGRDRVCLLALAQLHRAPWGCWGDTSVLPTASSPLPEFLQSTAPLSNLGLVEKAASDFSQILFWHPKPQMGGKVTIKNLWYLISDSHMNLSLRYRSPTLPPPRPTWVHMQLWDSPPLLIPPSSNTSICPSSLADFSSTWELAEQSSGESVGSSCPQGNPQTLQTPVSLTAGVSPQKWALQSLLKASRGLEPHLPTPVAFLTWVFTVLSSSLLHLTSPF